MTSEEANVKKRRILRFIRDLDLRYIRGSIDRRTYQTLKNKYQEILTALPTPLKIQEEEKAIEQSMKALPQLESDIQEIEKEPSPTLPAPVSSRVVEIPPIEIEDIPLIEIEELKIALENPPLIDDDENEDTEDNDDDSVANENEDNDEDSATKSDEEETEEDLEGEEKESEKENIDEKQD